MKVAVGSSWQKRLAAHAGYVTDKRPTSLLTQSRGQALEVRTAHPLDLGRAREESEGWRKADRAEVVRGEAAADGEEPPFGHGHISKVC